MVNRIDQSPVDASAAGPRATIAPVVFRHDGEQLSIEGTALCIAVGSAEFASALSRPSSWATSSVLASVTPAPPGGASLG